MDAALANVIIAQRLRAAIVAIAPIDGVSVGDPLVKTTYGVTWPPGYVPTAQNLAGVQTAINAFDPAAPILNVVPFPGFIGRWTDPEYALLMQRRATAIGGGNVVLVKQWDQALAAGQVDLNSSAAQNFKAAIVSAGILTQARADVIFS